MPDLLSTILIVAAMVIGFQLLIARPAKARQAEQQRTLDAVQPGTRIMTTSGIFGTVRHVGTRQLIIEIGPGVDMTVAKAAVNKVVTPDEEDFEYDDDAPDAPDALASDEFPRQAPDAFAREVAEDDGFAQAIGDEPAKLDPVTEAPPARPEDRRGDAQ